jgi:fructose-bisphosphate aldolase class II
VLEERPDVVDPRKYVSAGRDAITAETSRLLTLLATA